jgi:hypothetical protein
MWRFDDDEAILAAILMGTIVQVEASGTPIDLLRLTFSDSRRVVLMAQDGELLIEEENIPQA